MFSIVFQCTRVKNRYTFKFLFQNKQRKIMEPNIIIMFIKLINKTFSKECLQVQGILQIQQKCATSTKRQYQVMRRAKHAPT